ncbi:Ig-like domain-containing protein, partial [Marinagarivorans algicola]|uniref:Ig-like domain-containing protein n=1 Tax=Marinagarivorans algicola TaxID=1513270 RepID=UPI003735FA4B
MGCAFLLGCTCISVQAATITIDTIAANDFVDANEDDADIIISGATRDVENGQIISATLNTKTYTTSVNRNAWSLRLPQQDVVALKASNTLTVEVSDRSGNAADPYTKYFAYDSATILDNDNDGVADRSDLDSDNDGILNTQEQICALDAEVNTELYTPGRDLTAGARRGVITNIAELNGNYFDLGYRLTGGSEWGSGITIINEPQLSKNVIKIQPKNVSDGTGSAIYTLTFNNPVFIENMMFGALDYDDRLIFEAYDESNNAIILGAPNFTSNGSVVPQDNAYTFVGPKQLFEPANYALEVLSLNVRHIKVKKLVITSDKASGSSGNNTIEISTISHCVTRDTDNDGIPDYFDLDSDDDSIPDNIEAQTTAGYIAPSGIINKSTGVDLNYAGGLDPVNTLSNGDQDYIEIDSDGDGLSDLAEVQITLSDTVGVNGLDTVRDNGDTYTDVNGTLNDPTTLPNLDSANDVDYREINTPAITIDVVAFDDVINTTEDNSPVPITGTTTNIEDGQTVVVTLNGKNYTAVVSNNTWSTTLPARDAQALDASENMTANASSAAGAAVEAMRTIRHVLVAPTVTIDIVAGDDVINTTEDNSSVTLSGTTTNVENGQIVTVAVNGKTYTATVFNNAWSTEMSAADAQALGAREGITANVSNTVGDVADEATRIIAHTVAPPVISINVVAGDDVINASEDDSDITLSGTTTNVEDGQTVTVTVNGKTYSATVKGNTWSTTLPAADAQALDATESITANVTNAAGDKATEAARTVSHSVVLPTVTINAVAGDDVINASEDDSDITLSGTTTNVEDGQTVTVTVNGKTYSATVKGNTWSTTLPAADAQALDATENITANVTNAAGDKATEAARTVSHSVV